MKQRTLSILVDNTAGVLQRVAGLFSRRDYNIDSLTVGETADPRYSRMTVVAKGDDNVLDQIMKQVAKLEDVKTVKILDPDSSVQRELIMIKVKCDATQRQSLVSLTSIFRAKIIDVGKESLIIEATGAVGKLEALIDLLGGFEILEIARTGLTGLSRGSDDVTYL